MLQCGSVCSKGTSPHGTEALLAATAAPWEWVWGKDRTEGIDDVQACWRSPSPKSNPTTWPHRTSSLTWGGPGPTGPEPGLHFLTGRSLCLASATSSSWETEQGGRTELFGGYHSLWGRRSSAPRTCLCLSTSAQSTPFFEKIV